jgi:hypothetical protein
MSKQLRTLESDAAAPNPVKCEWPPGVAPVSVVMLALNEAHNMEAVLDNLRGWARAVFLVDSYSRDRTVDIALDRGVHVVQREFRGFGDQWDFAVRELPITSPWTMKLDPDERLSPELKNEIRRALSATNLDAFTCRIRLFFMGRALPVRLTLTRLWRTGRASFNGVSVNEHAQIAGVVGNLASDIEHHDSPNLEHWLNKQNKYTTAEALSVFEGRALAATPRLLGSSLERRMWLKRHYQKVPLRYTAMFLYHYIWLGAWRAGWVGYAWSRLRCDVYRLWEYKLREMRISGPYSSSEQSGPGSPDPRVPQF